MTEIDHWHPVARRGSLRRKPLAVRICGREVVLFRIADGTPGALEDRCPHRRMRLSKGAVAGDRLVCPYHGWSYERSGAGESPGTPKLHACAEHYDVEERHGAIWLRAAGSKAAFPELRTDGHERICTLENVFAAPLETVLDNFTEVEHTATTHLLFGYSSEDMPKVETRVEATDDAVRVSNKGPQKPIPRVVEWITGARSGDVFTDDWTTRFSPVHAIYDQWWQDPATGAARPDRLLVYVFLTPITDAETLVFTFAFTSPPGGRFVRNRLIKAIIRRVVAHEVNLDQRMIANLADPRPQLVGMQLGRFDKALGENRMRIERIYRGREG